MNVITLRVSPEKLEKFGKIDTLEIKQPRPLKKLTVTLSQPNSASTTKPSTPLSKRALLGDRSSPIASDSPSSSAAGNGTRYKSKGAPGGHSLTLSGTLDKTGEPRKWFRQAREIKSFSGFIIPFTTWKGEWKKEDDEKETNTEFKSESNNTTPIGTPIPE
ncbi:BA75_00595T0 [Komagataella pastoris]|uniref:BA75_00595T0 n=1 Tax=Komagataella pastoris TaxID=4922 RepID=A0A1B2J9J8_PICPA|nr:BA75_00595T0 [Komagataella pastoris]